MLKCKLKLKQVELVFENCEYCIIPAKFIYHLSVSCFNRRLDYSNINGLLEFNRCKLDYLEISNDFLLNSYPRFTEEAIDKDINLFDRLKDGKDVVSIELVYNGKKNRTPQLYLPWNDENEYSNKYQTFEIKEKTSILKVSKEERNELEI